MLFAGGFLAMIIRAELFQPGLQLVQPLFYNSLVTMHGLTMIFLAIMPALVGLANWQIPLMIGADVPPCPTEKPVIVVESLEADRVELLSLLVEMLQEGGIPNGEILLLAIELSIGDGKDALREFDCGVVLRSQIRAESRELAQLK